MDFFAELDRITRAYTNPLTVAEKIAESNRIISEKFNEEISRAVFDPAYKTELADIIRRDYAQMPEYVEPRAVEHWDELAKRRDARRIDREMMLDSPTHDL